MSQPSPTDVHIDAALTDISIAYEQDEANYIAGQVFPPVPVQHQTNKYFTFTKDDWFRDDAVQKRSPRDESAGSGYNLSSSTYSCDVWATHIDVDDQTRANADPAVPVEDAASRLVMQRMLIRREREWAAEYFVTGKWDTNKTGGTDFTAWDDNASDPEKDIQDGKETMLQNTGFEPNTLTVAYPVHLALKRHPLIKDRFKYTTSESITADMLARFFEIDRYLIAKAVYSTTAEGDSTPTMSFALAQNALLTYRPPSPGIMVPSAGYNFVWSNLTGINDLGVAISNIDMRGAGKKVDRVEGEFAFDLKPVATDLGYMFLAATS